MRFFLSINIVIAFTINTVWARVDDFGDSQQLIHSRLNNQKFDSEQFANTLKLSIKDIDDLLFSNSTLRKHTAFVKELGNNQFEVAPDMQRTIPTLIDMNQLAYAMGRDETLKILSITNELTNLGWAIRPFNGFSGKDNRAEDVPGFVAYNKESNQFTIVLRGSHTKIGEEKSADWEVNLDGNMIDTLHGKFHQGFYNRSNAMIDNIVAQLYYFYDQMPASQRASASITVTGHSQGAALATLIATDLIDRLKDQQLLGSSFNNQTSNIVTVYLLSAPRVGDQQARDWIHHQIGKQNIVRQNVVGLVISDPVPSASPGKTLTKLLKKIPIVGDKLAGKFGGDGGAASVGYLAADLAKDVLKRNLKSEDLALRERVKSRLNLTTSQLLNLIDNKPANFFKIFSPQQITVTFNNLVIKNLSDSFQTYLSPLHYGGSKDQLFEGAFFQQSVVAGYTHLTPQLSQLLTQGAIKKDKSFEGFKQKVKLFLGI